MSEPQTQNVFPVFNFLPAFPVHVTLTLFFVYLVPFIILYYIVASCTLRLASHNTAVKILCYVHCWNTYKEIVCQIVTQHGA